MRSGFSLELSDKELEDHQYTPQLAPTIIQTTSTLCSSLLAELSTTRNKSIFLTLSTKMIVRELEEVVSSVAFSYSGALLMEEIVRGIIKSLVDKLEFDASSSDIRSSFHSIKLSLEEIVSSYETESDQNFNNNNDFMF